MSSVSIPLVEMGKTMEETVQNLYDAYYKLARTVEHGFLSIDSTNIKEFDGKSVKVKNIEAKSIITDQLIVGTNVALGTAVTASGVTTIIDGRITTDYLNAIGIAAESITGTVITGKTLQTGSSGERFVFNGDGIFHYSSGVTKHGAQLYNNTGIANIQMWYAGNVVGNIDAISGAMIIDTPYGGSITVGGTYTNIKATYLGFFGTSPASKQSAALLPTPGSYSYTAGATYTSNEQGMLNVAKQDINDLKNKVNGVIDKLGLYGLFTVT